MFEKLLLLGINSRYTHSNLAIRYLRNSLSGSDFEVALREATINQSDQEIIELIWNVKPDILAISVYIWNAEIVKRLLLDIKKILPKVQIILGGPEVSYNHQYWLDNFSQINHIACGNGELTLRNLLLKGSDQRLVPNINSKFSDVDFPYLRSDFPFLQQKYIYYETSRGCSFRCSYCLSSRSDQKLDFKPVEKVISELQWLLDKKPQIIKFVDRTFNSKPEHYQPIWRFLIDNPSETKFHCEIHPEFLREEDFAILATAPDQLFQFEIGIQSTNPQTIEAINRQDHWQKSKLNIQRLIGLKKFHIHTDLIVGLPFEDITSLARSFDDIIALESDHFQMGFLKVLPGTEMAERKDEYEIITSDLPPYEILANSWLNFDQMLFLKQIEGLVDKYHNSEKFHNTIRFCHKLFGSPYRFYAQFAIYLAANNYDKSIKNWNKNAEQLVNFINPKFQDRSLILSDLLCYDWCINFSGAIPKVIESQKNQQLQKDCYQYLKKYNHSGVIKFQDHIFETKDIKNANYFLAESEEFYDYIDLPRRISMFIKTKKILDFKI